MAFLERYGPWALIAGASEGTGAAFARTLAAHGFKLILVARRVAPLATIAEALRAAHGTECITASVDLAEGDAAAALAALAQDREVGLFVANAGSDPNGSAFLAADPQAWRALVDRNVTTTMLACHALAPAMVARGKGGILLVGSGACYGGGPGLGVYAGTKAFELCFGEGLWAELAPHGVDVLSLLLGRTDTPELRRLLSVQGVPVPAGLADPDAVARMGLERLPHGPVHNWGLDDGETGYAPQSAAMRRDRVRMIARATADLAFGEQGDPA